MKIKLYTEENFNDTIFIQTDIFDGILTADPTDVGYLYDIITGNRDIEDNIRYMYSFQYERILKTNKETINIINLKKLNESGTEVVITTEDPFSLKKFFILSVNNEESNFIINSLMTLINVIVFYDEDISLWIIKLPVGYKTYSIELEC